jgi:hypothetical protein
MMLENNILKSCIERIRQIPAVKSVQEKKREVRNGPAIHDATLEILTDWGPLQLVAEIKKTIKRPMLQHLLLMKKDNLVPLILLAEYVNTAIGEDLRKNRINFIDCQGNAFLYIPGKIFVDIQGKKPVKEIEKTQTALFQPKGMQLLFVLLTQENAINEPIRVLKQKAGIAFERTATAITELKTKGFVFETKDKRLQFVNKRNLLEKWLANYGDRLRPKLVLGAYKIAPSAAEQAPDLLQKAFPDDNGNYAIGGGLAGDLLMHYYRGPTTEIFVLPDQVGKVCRTLKLIPARETDATLLNLFTPAVIYQKQNLPHPIAHPLLIYAELLYQGGDRAAEAAGQIYDAYLKPDLNEG